jgi:hypothetical protein
MVFFLSNFLIGINPHLRNFHAIRIMSIIVIILILYYNTKHLSIATAFILPLSLNRVTYADKLNRYIEFDSEIQTQALSLLNVNEISEFLDDLDAKENYIASFEFIPDICCHQEEGPLMFLSKPILMNKFSSPEILTKFIHERLELMVDYYYLDDSIIQTFESGNEAILSCRYTIAHIY